MTWPDRAGAVTRLFDRLSPVYDTPAVQAVMYRPAQDELIRELRRTGAQRIADIGCGTGILAARITAELDPASVYGCDASEGMLEEARARSDQVEWLNCRSESLPFPTDSLDAVVSSHAFHWFDQPAALAEFRRVLRPDGLIAIVIVNPHTQVGSRLVRASSAGAGCFPDARSMRLLLTNAGFSGVEQRRVRRGPVGFLSPDAVTLGRA